MSHVYHYYTHYYKVDIPTAVKEFELYKPYPNANCVRCHSTQVRGWLSIEDHDSDLARLRSGEVSCVSEGCHGPVHPFSKPKKPKQAHR